VLPPKLRDDARDLRARVLYMIYLEEMGATSPSASRAASAAVAEQRQRLAAVLPDDLERFAAEIEAAMHPRRRLHVRSVRFPHHPTSSGVR
jgi:hypothetical protein